MLRRDVFSHTAAGRPDVPQQWLAEVVYAAVERGLGPYALRALAGAVLAGCVAAAALVLARARAGAAAVAAGTSLFLVLGWWWLLQLRPHGFSIAALLGLSVLLEGPLDRRRAAVVLALGLVWMNLHAVGLLAPIAAAGVAVVELGARLRGRDPEGPRPDPVRPAALALALGVASLVATPAGLDLWRFSFAHAEDLKLVPDEWSRLDLLAPEHSWHGVQGPVHAAACLVLALVLVAAASAVATPEGRARAVAARRRIALAALGCALALLAVRFLFALVLPLAWALSELRVRADALAPLVRARVGAAGAVAAAAVAWLALLGYLLPLDPRLDLSMDARMFHAASVAEWKEPWLEKKTFPELTRFLADAGVEGDLWNAYHTGGQLLLRLHPRGRVFVDARTLVYGARLIQEAAFIAAFPERPEARALLDRHGVDVIAGTRLLGRRGMGYEVGEGDPAWVLVFQSEDVAIRLRRAASRTPANVARIAAYYAERGVPFDATAGFSRERAIAEAAEWARAMRVR